MLRFIAAFSVLLLSFPSLAAQTLKNGAPFFSSRDADLPRNVFILSFLGGPAVLSPEQQGVIPVLREALNEGPSDLSVSEFKNQLFSLGADFDYSAQGNVFDVIVRVPPAQQVQALELVKRTLGSPRVSKEDFDRYKGNVLAATKAGFENMRHVVLYFAMRDLFSYSPASMTGDTSPTSLEKLTYEAFTSSAKKVFNSQLMFVSYVGQEPEGEARKKFETAFAERLDKKFLGWKPNKAAAPRLKGMRYTVINKTGATDNQIVFAFPQDVKRDAAEWTDAKLLMDLLGGGLHGKLGHTLRTLRGLTYHASSSISSSNLPVWVAYTFGGVEQTKPLLAGVPEVIASFKKGKLSATEVGEAKARLVNEHKTETELPKDTMRELAWYFVNGYNPSHFKQYENDLLKADEKRVSKLKDTLNIQNATVYLMGDKEVLLKALEESGVKRETVRVVEQTEIR